jgi:hypothetical protein
VNRVDALLLLLRLGATVEKSKIETKRTIYLYDLRINETIVAVLDVARVAVRRSQDRGAIDCTVADWAKSFSSEDSYNAWFVSGVEDWKEWSDRLVPACKEEKGGKSVV